MPDDLLRAFSTERQWEVLCVLDGKTQRQAAEALGVTRNVISQVLASVRVKAAKAGYSPENDMVHTVPRGFYVKGTSTLYGDDGQVKQQWVKSQVDQEQQEEIFREAIEGMISPVPKARPTVGPKSNNANLMTVIPVSDHHLGMYSWKPETDGNYNLDIAEEVLMGAMDHLVSVGPDSEHAMIVTLGDFLHYDSYAALTPASGHLLDADSRFPRMVRVAMRLLRYLVTAALRRHQKVTMVIQQGNHDPSSTIFLREAMSHIYDNEARLTVDTDPKPFSCHQFGKNMIGTHHGDKVKLGALPLLFATDYPEIWGATEHRTIHTGHVHHDQVLLKEHSGAVCESHRILAPKDSYAANNGWRAQQSMKAIVLHDEYGEVERHTFSPQMIDA